MKICLFASEKVGLEVVKIIKKNNYDLAYFAIDSKNDERINQEMLDVLQLPKEKVLYSHELYNEKIIEKLKSEKIDLIILGWWHYIIKEPLLSIPRLGLINFHPSYLPYNRGKHYYFWNLVEEVPYGVTIHYIDEKVDNGDIIFQKRIPLTYEDNGCSLREKGQVAMIELFEETFETIISGSLPRRQQEHQKGRFHLSNELEVASEIDLEKTYTGKELINLLRGRSGFDRGGCHFYACGKKYEVTINIKEV